MNKKDVEKIVDDKFNSIIIEVGNSINKTKGLNDKKKYLNWCINCMNIFSLFLVIISTGLMGFGLNHIFNTIHIFICWMISMSIMLILLFSIYLVKDWRNKIYNIEEELNKINGEEDDD